MLKRNNMSEKTEAQVKRYFWICFCSISGDTTNLFLTDFIAGFSLHLAEIYIYNNCHFTLNSKEQSLQTTIDFSLT